MTDANSSLDSVTSSQTCMRCGSDLDAEGYCRDATCPFSDHLQHCRKGWTGHRGQDPRPRDETTPLRCTCQEDEDPPEYYTHFSDRYLMAIEKEGTDLSFLVSIGNSSSGPVGTCLRVVAGTPEAALQKARQALSVHSDDSRQGYPDLPHSEAYRDVEYIATYFNPASVGPEHIVFAETEIA